MITIEIAGQKFEGFEEIAIFKSIESISGSFSLSATSNNVKTFPIKQRSACKMFIGNESVIDGFIDSINVDYDATTHSLTIRGRDKTSDVIDSTVAKKKEFVGPIAFKDIIRKSLDDNGLNNIKIINEAGTIEDFKKGEFISVEVGQTLFDFIEKYARKRQILLTTNGDGDIVFTRGSSTQAIVTLQNRVNGEFNNIKSGRIIYNDNERFNKYIVKSQLNNSAISFGADVTNSNVVDQQGEALDKKIRTTRQLELPSRTSDNTVDLNNLATWNANLRRARSADFSVTVQGFHQDKGNTRLWKFNELVNVVDEFADVNSSLLIRSVEYRLNLTEGSVTILSLVAKDAYTLEAQLNEADAKANEQGGNLIFDF